MEGNDPESDSIIRQCLNYYQSVKDKKNLAECYYYEALYFYYQGNEKKAFWNMYQADRTAASTDDISLKHKIKECLLDWNNSAEEYTLALKYGKENFYLSSLSGNKNWMAYAYALMAVTYNGLGNVRKSEEYLNKSITYISSVPRKEQAQFYVSLGSTLIDSDPMKAELYFKKALKACPLPSVYSGLGVWEFQKGNVEAAEKYFQKALRTKDVSTKEFTLQNMQSLYALKGDYKKAYNILQELNKLQTQKFKEQKNNNILFIQRDFENQIRKQEIYEMVGVGLFVVILAVLIVVAVYFWLHFKNEKWKKTSLQTQLVLNVYKDKLEKIRKLKETDNKASVEHEKAQIQKKIETYQDLQTKILYRGKTLYQDVLDGKNTLTWNKKDFENFLEYYKLVDLPFATHLQTDYDHLSPRYQFFLVLKNMGKTEEEIQNVMVISSTTIRTIKSRVKSSKLDQ